MVEQARSGRAGGRAYAFCVGAPAVSWRPGPSTGANGAPVAVFIAGFSLRATRLRRPESARLPVPCALFRCPGKGVAGTRREDAGRIGFFEDMGEGQAHASFRGGESPVFQRGNSESGSLAMGSPQPRAGIRGSDGLWRAHREVEGTPGVEGDAFAGGLGSWMSVTIMAHRAQAFGEDVQEVAAGEDGAFEALGAGAGRPVSPDAGGVTASSRWLSPAKRGDTTGSDPHPEPHPGGRASKRGQAKPAGTPAWVRTRLSRRPVVFGRRPSSTTGYSLPSLRDTIAREVERALALIRPSLLARLDRVHLNQNASCGWFGLAPWRGKRMESTAGWVFCFAT
jgi:hypothetical protein